MTAAQEELEMLRLQLDVNRADDMTREARLREVERRLQVGDEFLGAMAHMFRYLADSADSARMNW